MQIKLKDTFLFCIDNPLGKLFLKLNKYLYKDVCCERYHIDM